VVTEDAGRREQDLVALLRLSRSLKSDLRISRMFDCLAKIPQVAGLYDESIESGERASSEESS
jgi:hypothetical protein